MAAEKVITIAWRNENYGRVYDAQSFRYQKEPWPSDTETRSLARLFRKHDFEFNVQRCCWMAEFKPADVCVKLVEALESAGYTVNNTGAVPDVLESAPASRM